MAALIGDYLIDDYLIDEVMAGTSTDQA